MTTSKPQLTLYSYFRSSASARVRTVMELHDIPHDTKYIHLLKGEQKSDTYSELNPAQTVPTLVVKEADGREWHVAQCIAIMEYLDEVWGPDSKAGRLLPQDSAEARAKIRSIVDILIGDLFPMLTLGTLNRLRARGVNAEEWAAECVKHFLTSLEALLKQTSTSGKYCYGDSLTLADVTFGPQMYTVLRYSPNAMNECPTVKSIFEHVSNLPAFVAADFRHQPDTPEDLRAK